jgi:phage gpG-like protein
MSDGVSMRIEIDGAQALAGALYALREAAIDPVGAWDAVGRRWVSLTQERFATGTSPSGAPWKPSRRVELFGGKTLVLSRGLEGSLTHEADADGVTIGTNKKYAAVHQFGATIVPKKPGGRLVFGALESEDDAEGNVETPLAFARKVTIPPRPFIGTNNAYFAEFEEVIVTWLRNTVDNAASGVGGSTGGGAAPSPGDAA